MAAALSVMPEAMCALGRRIPAQEAVRVAFEGCRPAHLCPYKVCVEETCVRCLFFAPRRVGARKIDVNSSLFIPTASFDSSTSLVLGESCAGQAPCNAGKPSMTTLLSSIGAWCAG